MNFLDAEFVQEFIRMANDGWEQGWHERNGGNLSYRVKPEEVELIKENFKAKEWQPIGTSVPNLAVVSETCFTTFSFRQFYVNSSTL